MCAKVVDIPQIVVDGPFGGRSLALTCGARAVMSFGLLVRVADLSFDFRNKD